MEGSTGGGRTESRSSGQVDFRETMGEENEDSGDGTPIMKVSKALGPGTLSQTWNLPEKKLEGPEQ